MLERILDRRVVAGGLFSAAALSFLEMRNAFAAPPHCCRTENEKTRCFEAGGVCSTNRDVCYVCPETEKFRPSASGVCFCPWQGDSDVHKRKRRKHCMGVRQMAASSICP